MSLSVNMVGQNLAMDGRTNTNSDVVKHVTSGYTPPENVNKEAASVAEDFADLDYQVSQLQRISDQIGRKLQFNVNKELNRVLNDCIMDFGDSKWYEYSEVSDKEAEKFIKEMK